MIAPALRTLKVEDVVRPQRHAPQTKPHTPQTKRRATNKDTHATNKDAHATHVSIVVRKIGGLNPLTTPATLLHGAGFVLLHAQRVNGREGRGEQSRIEEVGQALLFRCEEAASGLDLLRGTRRATRYWSGSGDAYEEHMLLPDDRVALLTDRAILLVHAPGFPAINASYEGGGGPTLEADIPKSEVKWEAAWKVHPLTRP